jgi:DNA mismatch repair protein MutL
MDDISWGGITESVAQPMDQPGLPTGDVPLLRPIGQVGAAYLVAEGPDGLYLIDQHAAHERVLFEKWMRRVAEARLEAQAYLEPQSVTLSPAQVDLLQGQLKALTHLGFDVEPFGPGTFQVRAVPGILAHLSASEALRVLVEDFEEDESPLADELEARVAARVCKRAAIKAGQILALSEQAALIRDLEACDSPRTCPHGRPTMVHISVDSLERQFGRRGPY